MKRVAASGELEASRSRRRLALLSVGALLGAVLAGVGVLRPASEGPPDGGIARVNDRVIRSERFEQLWQRVASDKRNPMTEADRARVLQRMIEEELLIQRGEAIGLVQSDPAIRKAISVAMIQSIVAESAARPLVETELRAFYQQNRRYFAPTETLRARQLVFQARPGETKSDQRDRARAARRAIAQGLSFAAVGQQYADPPIVEVPDVLLPAKKLQQYIGATPLESLRELKPLEVSDAISSGGEIRILQLLERVGGSAAGFEVSQVSGDSEGAEPQGSMDFESVRDRVVDAFRRDRADRALRGYLERLWREAEIALSPDAPAGLE